MPFKSAVSLRIRPEVSLVAGGAIVRCRRSETKTTPLASLHHLFGALFSHFYLDRLKNSKILCIFAPSLVSP